MDLRPPYGKKLLVAVIFLASTVVLSVQLITPSPVVVSVGESGTEVAEVGNFFRYHDVAIIVVSGILLGASGTHLLTSTGSGEDVTAKRRGSQTNGTEDNHEPSEELLEARRREWEETAERLGSNEERIYRVILDADGVIAQSDIAEEIELSKATVSRTLDSLESKNVVERKRRGMGNMVLLL